MLKCALNCVFCLLSYSAKRGHLISRCRADLTGIRVSEKGPVTLNFCAADFCGEVLMLFGGVIFTYSPLRLLLLSMKACVSLSVKPTTLHQGPMMCGVFESEPSSLVLSQISFAHRSVICSSHVF